MYTVRRHDLAPRLDLLPMIDVIFLLLTFFIISMVQMVNLEVLPLKLRPLRGDAAATPGPLHDVTISGDGRFYFDNRVMEPAELRAKLAELAALPTPPTLFLGVDRVGTVDRGPLLMQLVEMAHTAGILDLAFIGPPGAGADGEGQ